ncbi:MAG: DUF354 domain-containing protein [Patescibacteria group bacterium]
MEKRLVDEGHHVLACHFTVPPSGLLDWGPEIVITGLAAWNTEHELVISKLAMAKQIPVVWFADTYGVFAREKIGDLRPNLLLVPDELEKKKAKEFGYKNIIASGIPFWEEFADLSLYPRREETRKKLGIESKRVVLLPGLNIELSRQIATDVIAALKDIPNIVLLPRFHSSGPEHKDLLKEINWVDSSAIKKTEDLIPAADLMISVFSTLGIMAAHQRKRVIDYIPKSLMDVLEQVTKRRYWVPAESGATLGVYKKEDLVPAINYLFTPEGYAELIKKQKEVYSAKKGIAVKKMIAALEDLVKISE